MTTGAAGSEFKEGDKVTITAGQDQGKQGVIVSRHATQATLLGKESYFLYKVDVSPEFFMVKELRKSF